jgi:hypothetical protein
MQKVGRRPKVAFLVAAVLLVNLGALAAHLVLRQRLATVGDLRPGARLAAPSGIAADGRTVATNEYAGHPCHVVRYESTRCGYCTLDHAVFERLAREASGRSCSVTIVAPAPDQFFSRPVSEASLALAYPTVEAARSLPSYGTPTTIVADGGWTVAWSKSGALGDADPPRAFAALDEYGRDRGR